MWLARVLVSCVLSAASSNDLEGELGIEFFERQRKGAALTPAGKSFLIDARRILEDCETSIKKAQRISRGKIGKLTIGYMSAMTHDFLVRHCKFGD